jgi:predicted HicB family RNase H-like nuclease
MARNSRSIPPAPFGRRVAPPRPPTREKGQARLAVNLPNELHKQLKVKAAEKGMTIRDYVIRLLQRDGLG